MTGVQTCALPIFGALAYLNLGRACAMEADATQEPEATTFRTKSRSAYLDFLTLWKDADKNIPILNTARAEYDRLH